MYACWQKDGVYSMRLIGSKFTIIETTDWRNFSSELKLTLDHESTLSKVHADPIENRRNSTF